jgi:hypothetical protein
VTMTEVRCWRLTRLRCNHMKNPSTSRSIRYAPLTIALHIFPAICLVIPFIEIVSLITVASEKRLGLVDNGQRGIYNNRQGEGRLKRRRPYRLVWDFSPWTLYRVCLRLSDRLFELNLTTFSCLQDYSVYW